MGEERAGVGGRDAFEGQADCLVEGMLSASANRAQDRLELAEGVLDRREVGRVGGRKRIWQWRASIKVRTASALCTLRLSRITIWPGTKVGHSSSRT
jgi:hypothetical protein